MAGNESSLTVIFSLIFSCLFASLATSSDTLRQGNILNSSSYLVSAKKIFTLGFFVPPYSNSSYLGIWFTIDPYPHGPAVWVGNRNIPIANNSGALTIDSAGNLIITHGGGKPIEVYRSQTGANITATLSDFGNFIVREVMNGSILWESFDYPADTLLPGMKLGVNHRTGRSWSLTSWFSPGLPAPGAFTLDWDPSGRRLIVRRRGVIYWTSGILGDKDFEFIETNPSSLNYKFMNVTNKEEEEYFTYSILNDSISSPKDPRANVSGWWLNFQGDIYDASRPPIALVSFCYGYNSERGCQLWEQPKCRNSYQKFDLKSGRFGDINNEWSADNNKSLSMSDCRDKCWNDCDCIGFIIGGPGDGTGGPACVFWRGNLKFRQDHSGSLLFVLISEPPPSQPPSEAPSLPPSLPLSEPPHKRRNRIWILIAVGIAVVMVVFGLLCYQRRKKIRFRWEDGTTNAADLTELMAPEGYMNASELQNDESNGNDLKVFSFGDVVAATNSFSPQNKLGEGGFGPVYKGKLINGTEIAIKRLSGKWGQGVVEFKNELKLMAKLQHVNLVRLLGCCIQGDDKMLIYEYMLNRSLDCFLFDPTRKEQLTWQKRFNIIEGIAQGILYLHKYSRLKIIHRDLKASNILLDEHLNPKISDFGLARIFKQHVVEANTNRVVGTYGYMAPEYALHGLFSVKSDVFSFGVLMFEIVSGRKNNSFHHRDGPLNLVGYAWELWNKDAALELVDPLLRDSCIEQQLLRCIHVGLLCVEDRAADRPTISDVVSMLNNDTIALPPPKKPAFVSGNCVDEGDSSKSELEKGSLNALSITAMDGR